MLKSIYLKIHTYKHIEMLSERLFERYTQLPFLQAAKRCVYLSSWTHIRSHIHTHRHSPPLLGTTLTFVTSFLFWFLDKPTTVAVDLFSVLFDGFKVHRVVLKSANSINALLKSTHSHTDTFFLRRTGSNPIQRNHDASYFCVLKTKRSTIESSL